MTLLLYMVKVRITAIGSIAIANEKISNLDTRGILLLEEFWHSLTAVEQAQLVKIYDSLNPEECKDDPIAVRLMQWFKIKKEVSLKSRAAAL